GVRSLFPFDREAEDHVHCTYEYPASSYKADDPELCNKKIVVSYSSINGNGFGDYGEVVMGTKGTLILERESETLLIPAAGAVTAVSVVKGKGGGNQQRLALAL